MPKVTVVGIGEDGWAGLSPAARDALNQARQIVGAERQIALLPKGLAPARAWPSPMHKLIDEIAAGDRPVVVLASGDPLLYGVATTLARRLPPDSIEVIPAVSAAALACARLGWEQQTTTLVSACGRPIAGLIPELFDGTRVILLSADRATPHQVASLLAIRGFTASIIHVMEHLGGAQETIHVATVAGWPADQTFADLNLLAIELRADADALILAKAPGLPDDAFDHDGQITKRDIRAATLARLSPRPGQLLWDIGTGSGSIAIEWLRASPTAQAIGIDRNPSRAARARGNAEHLGVPRLQVIEGAVPAALEGLARPDAIFIGGGLTAPGLIDLCWQALKPGGRLVANTVTLESEALLLAEFAARGGELTRLSISHTEALGGFTGWRPAMPVVQWAIEKPLV
jgi:precorrin-6Y C5,15-methyltransferase (decarboxylating)